MLYPQYYYDSILDIPYEKLFSKGIRGIVFDVDNTMACHDELRPSLEIVLLVNRLLEMGFKVALLSNGSATRVNTFNQSMNLPAVSRAAKPFTSSLSQLIKEMQLDASFSTVIIGDQIFADVLCGNLIGITTILVKPVSEKEVFVVRIKRGLERWILRRYSRGQL